MALGIVSAADVEMRVREDECMRTVRPPAPGPHRALQLPEVVRLILAYAVAQPLDPPPLISGSNKLHIRPNDRWMTHWWLPLLVCKAWYFLGQSLLLHEISWNHEDHIHNSPCGAQLPTDKKDRASPSSTVVMPDPVRQGGRRPACTLRELSFRGDFTYSGELYRFLTNKTIAQSLTLLELSYAHGHRYFELDITMFFESNIGGGGRSVNRELSMFNDNHGQIIVNNNNNDSNDNNDNNMQYKALILPHLQHLLIERIHLAHVPPEWKPSQPSLLKTLRMSRIKTDNVSLETLLAGLCGPWLEDLEVTMIALPPQEQLTYPTRPYLQNPATLRRIAETCPRLFAVRLQQTLETRAFDALRGIYNYFPTVQQASLVCSKGHLPEISGLYQMTRHLTKLFITTKALQASREIHDFLCSDVAEPLEELYLKGQ
ncbi:hypothetical protein BGZ73_000629 [Actinomortierella ambigua]|nr:hypothetical protein BGZ73_000629 [Actinomortierella ambigua]